MLGEGRSGAEQLCHAWLAADGGGPTLLFDKECLRRRDRVDNLFTPHLRRVGCVYAGSRLGVRDGEAACRRSGIVNGVTANRAFTGDKGPGFRRSRASLRGCRLNLQTSPCMSLLPAVRPDESGGDPPRPDDYCPTELKGRRLVRLGSRHIRRMAPPSSSTRTSNEQARIFSIARTPVVRNVMPEVSQVRRCELQDISLERLVYVLVSPDQHILSTHTDRSVSWSTKNRGRRRSIERQMEALLRFTNLNDFMPYAYSELSLMNAQGKAWKRRQMGE